MLSLEISLIPEELQISEFQSTDLLMMHLNGHPAYIRIPPMPENLFMFEAWSWRAVLLKVECRGHSIYLYHLFRNAELQAHPDPQSENLHLCEIPQALFIWKKHCLRVGFCVSELTSASFQFFSTGLGFALENRTKWCCPLSCMGQATVMVNIFCSRPAGLSLGGPSLGEWAVQRGVDI